MASPSNPSETDENKGDSSDSVGDEITRDTPESSSDEPLVIDAEVVEVENDEEQEAEISETEETAEIFPPSLEPAPRRASFVPMVLGGLVAGAIGFGVAYLGLPGLTGAQDQVAEMAQKADANASELTALTARLDDLAASVPAPVDTSGLEDDVASISARVGEVASDVKALQDVPPVDLSGITAELAALSERVTALEVREGNATSAQAAEAEKQLIEFKAELERLIGEAEGKIAAAETRAAEVEAEAAAAAEITAREAALAKLKAAVDGGSPFEDLIAGVSDVPEVLTAHADHGVPTLVVLQQEFPDAARAALAVSQTVPDDASTGARLTAFLRRQTNARSLTPKDGDDPDAVLSRAEGMLGQGELTAALSELSALPDPARAAMSEWLSDAETRLAALQAVDALSAKTN